MKRNIIVLLICTMVLVVGCNNLEVKDTSNNKEVGLVGVENDAEDISFFIDEVEYFDKVIYTYYPMPNLASYKFYKIEDVLYADFYFLEDSIRDEIQNSKNMFMDIFIINKPRPFGLSPSRELVEMNLKWNQVNYRVFIGDRNIIVNNIIFSDDSIKSNYFEDTRVKLPSRKIMTEAMEEFKKKIQRKYWWSIKEVSFQKSFDRNVLFIKIQSRNKINENAINYIKEEIELNLANILAKSSEEIYKMNQDYLGILIEFYSGDKKYYQETYCNGKEKYWFKEYWGNHDFFIHSD